jgi:preprotein translocase subunit SecD
MGKVKRLLTNWRVVVLLLFVLFMLFAIRPEPWNEGATIKSVMKNSTAALAGILPPKANAPPLSKEIILSINNKPVANVQDYYSITNELRINQTVQIRTNRGLYKLVTREAYQEIELNATQEITVNEVQEVNETINGTTRLVNKTVPVKKMVEVTARKPLGSVEDIGLRVDNAPTTNLRKGLDLQGGTRVLLRPAEAVSEDTLNLMIDSLKERLNVYGVSDIVVAPVQDKPSFLGEPNRYILVEIAGATEEEVKELLGKQGKFEATVGNITVFRGGNDVTYVCRTAECSGIDPQRGCGQVQGGYYCGFMFSIALSPEAAQRQATATKDLKIITESGGSYLSEQLKLFLDDQEVDALNIADDLKGRAVTDISITGSGFGVSQEEAVAATLENMKRLQTVLITGSLPVKLEIVRIDTISPTLGQQFLTNAWIAGLLAVAAVVVILVLNYRRIKIAIPIALTSVTEVLLTIGVYALFGWSFDLAAIAGLIVAVGTGVNDQIIIIDETLKKQAAEVAYGWKERVKKAFFIIFSGYCTEVVAMLPLLFAGAGLLKGFALTTIIVVSIGVFVTRPAYAAMIQILYEDKE